MEFSMDKENVVKANWMHRGGVNDLGYWGAGIEQDGEGY